MHILIPVLHRPAKPTGVCRHAANLAQCLAETEPVSRVTLLIGHWQQEYFEQSFLLNSKVQLVSVDINNTSFSRNWWFMFGLPKLARQLQPDIVHLSFPLPFVRQWFNSPVVSTVHDLYPYECPENFGYPQVWFNRAFLRQCVRNSNGLACVSKQTLSALTHYFPGIETRKKVETVYNIVDFSDVEPQLSPQVAEGLSPLPSRDLPLTESRCQLNPFLMTVAQHRKNKNLDLLIAAHAALLNDGRLAPDTLLVLVGSSGPETEHLKALVEELALTERVLFLSGLQDAELRWLYEQAALFVIASSTEGFCLPLVEALTLSCPTVCSDIPILREVGSEKCRYFSLNQKAQHNLMEAIAAKLAAGKNHEQPTENQFSRTHIAWQLLDFYRLFV